VPLAGPPRRRARGRHVSPFRPLPDRAAAAPYSASPSNGSRCSSSPTVHS
jgi:hypothetical protein